MIFGHQTDDHTKASDDQLPAGSPSSNSFIVGAEPVDQTASTTQTPVPSAPPADDVVDDEAPSIIEQPTPAEPTAENEIFGTVGLSDESEASIVTTPAPSHAATTTHVAPEPKESPEVSDEETDDTDVAEAQPESEILDITDTPNADLLVLKQQALNDLGPLVNQLEQTAEERFRTTMMMIQSTDNQDLIKDAYAAAQDIKDEKVRAQALLDVVNEINYFTQKSDEN